LLALVRSLGGFWLLVSLALSAALLYVTFTLPSNPRYEYRVVTPAEAMMMVNEQGWRVSERVRMTDQAVYAYRKLP
jgi:hypothetical protein